MSISRVWVRYAVATRNTQRRKPMKRHLVVMAIAALAAAAIHAASPKSEAAAGPAAYARLKTLVGEWEADTGMG
jgi:ABC-type glycerol-3-phosphate transport system substrate-binding protein